MNRHARLNALLDSIATHGHVDVDRTARTLGVSSSTVRRDLNHLHDQQLVSRTHGGAVATSVGYDLPIRYRSSRQRSEKLRIAQAAAALVAPGAVVGLNGGTTTTEVARAIADQAVHTPRARDRGSPS
jgi:DeoR family transcriptional regulator of aga operon